MGFAIHWHESAMGVHAVVLKNLSESPSLPEGLLDLWCSSPYLEFLILQLRGGVWGFAFLTASHVMQLLQWTLNHLVGLLVSGVRWFGVCTPALHLATCGTLTVSLTSVSRFPSRLIWIIRIVKHGEAYWVDVREVFSKVEHFQAPTILKIIILSGATTFLEK